MILSVASGKGGTGKTTVATNLALLLSEDGRAVRFLDCDVEEPNAALFLKPELTVRETVGIPVPQVDRDRCTYCGRCSEVCAYNAIAVFKGSMLVFPELCHGCGACSLLCPEGAITEVNREIGVVRTGTSNELKFYQGELNVGEPMAPPVIRAVKNHLDPESVNMIDAPPGTSCPVIQAVKGSDFTLLVTEPTPFGLNDLKLAVGMVRETGIRFGVLINQADIGDDSVERYCLDESIDVLGRIPHDREIAVLYSKGIPIYSEIPRYRKMFQELWREVERRIGR
jgi:MinD superfamily P-loop ATPase